MSRPVPHDLEAEAHLIGACLYRNDAISSSALIITPGDFHSPNNAATYQAILDLFAAGVPVDVRTVSDKLAGKGLADAELAAAMSGVPASTHAEQYARIVIAHAARRRLIAVASELADAAYGLADPAELVDVTVDGLRAVEVPEGRVPADFMELDTLLDAPVSERSPWVVPDLLRADWRVIVVAPEGAGKTMMLHSVAVCAAQGVQPFTLERVRPVRVLMVDLENPEDRIVHGCAPIRSQVQALVGGDYDRKRLMLWHRPGGIDLRARTNVSEFEAILERARPELVVMGPAYKASNRAKGEGWDEGAMAVQRVLDGLRTRFGFALLMEDHAPQSTAGGVRDLRPFGSSLWLRWPEIGIKLVPVTEAPAPRVLDVRRWRGDRLPNGWPDRLEESAPWPWRVPRYGEEAA